MTAEEAVTHEMIEAGIASLGRDDDRSSAEVALDCWVAMNDARPASATLEASRQRVERLEGALIEAERRRLTQAAGIIVEFGDLNGFRNLTDQELGAAVIQMATAAAATLDRARAALEQDPPATAKAEGEQ